MISTSVNAFLNFTPVARALFGNAVLTHTLPTMVPCRACIRKSCHNARALYKPDEFTVRVIVDIDGGLSWHCYRCRRTWDSLELLADINHNGIIDDAIYEVLRSPEFDTPPAVFTPEAIEDYKNFYVARHKSAASWSAASRRRWADCKDTHNILARGLGVSVQIMESHESAEYGVGRWLHATSNREIRDKLNGGIAPNLPDKQFSSCLAIPWSQLPGRITSLLLLGWQNTIRFWFPAGLQSADPGIMLLDALPVKPQRVIALSSPWLALWLQYKYLKEHNEPASVVAFHQDSGVEIWDQLGAGEVVFWGYRPSPALFKQAIRVPNSKVAWLKDSRHDITYSLASIERLATWNRLRISMENTCPASQRINSLVRDIHEPFAALRAYLLGLNPEEVASVLHVCNLDTHHVNRLLDEASPTDRIRLSVLLQQPERQKEIPYNGGRAIQIINQAEAGWYVSKGKNRRERISNVVASLSHFFRDGDNRIVYVGTVHYKGAAYPFTATEEALLRNTAKTLAGVVEDACGEVPVIRSTHATRIWDYMFEFSPTITTLRALTRVGWDRKKNDFITPHFSIQNGALVDIQSTGLTGAVPCYGLQSMPAPNSDDLTSWTASTECNGAMWAVLSAVMDNITSFTRGDTPRGIALVGDLAYAAGDKIARDLKLVKYAATEINTNVGKFNQLQMQHDMPVFVPRAKNPTTLGANVVTWLTMSGPKNAILSLSRAQAAAARASGNWLIIDTKDDTGDYRGDGSIAGIVMHYIAHYQLQTARAPLANRKAHNALWALLQWAGKTSTNWPLFVQNYAQEALCDSGQESQATRFIRMLFQLLHDGYIAKRHGSLPVNTTVTVDTNAKTVLVSKQLLNDMAFKRGLPVPDSPGITQALQQAGILLGEVGDDRDVWALDKVRWDREAQRWQAIAFVETDA